MRWVGELPNLAGLGLVAMLIFGAVTPPLPGNQTRVVTWGKDIAPIIFTHCSTCHRPGQVAPFPLITYHDAKKRAQLIALVTRSRSMPPWKPEPGYGDF